MTIKINGTNTTAQPSITGTDTDTGLVYGTDEVKIVTGGTDRVKVDSSGRLGVGTTSPAATTHCAGSFFSTSRSVPSSGVGPELCYDTGDAKSLLLSYNRTSSVYAPISIGGSQIEFATGGTERMRLDSAGSMVLASGTAFVSPYVYNSTTVSAANVHVQSAGFLLRATSSIKYKTNVETIQDQYADAILGCRPVWYQSTCEADKPEWGHWGFIAEEVAEIDPRLCFFKEEEDGTLEPEGVQYDRFVPHLLNLIKRQQQAIATLETQNASLEARLTALEGGAE